VTVAFIWMAETPVPIKDEPEPNTPQMPTKKTSKRLRAPDSPETRRDQARTEKTRMVTRRKGLEARADEKKEFHVPDDVGGDDELPSVMALIKWRIRVIPGRRRTDSYVG